MTDECMKKCKVTDVEKNACVCDVHKKSAEDKVEDLKQAIAALGFKVEETPDGDIKMS